MLCPTTRGTLSLAPVEMDEGLVHTALEGKGPGANRVSVLLLLMEAHRNQLEEDPR